MTHLLVTNDFPPKVGGIQSYLYELWRRMDPHEFVVLTANSDPRARQFDQTQAAEGRRIIRTRQRVLLPTAELAERIRAEARRCGARSVVLDPALPLGLLGPHLGLPYAVILHGAEVTVAARLPLSRAALSRVVSRADLVIAAGGYPEAEARRATRGPFPPVVQIPPGVDSTRFIPLNPDAIAAARQRFGLDGPGPYILGLSRLVPRKGFDTLIDACAQLSPRHPGLELLVGGTGRDQARLRRRAGTGRVRFLGRVSDEDLPDLLGCVDGFAMLCRNRWFGLEQEGFGIVFLEAAAAGIPQLAGHSGGSAEAVLDGETGLVVERPSDVDSVVQALESLLADEDLRTRMGMAARARAAGSFDYAHLAPRLAEAISLVGG